MTKRPEKLKGIAAKGTVAFVLEKYPLLCEAYELKNFVLDLRLECPVLRTLCNWVVHTDLAKKKAEGSRLVNDRSWKQQIVGGVGALDAEGR